MQITDEAGYIPRDEFVDYAKRSSAVKELTEKGLSSSRSATSGHTNLDKAELAFKVKILYLKLLNVVFRTNIFC